MKNKITVLLALAAAIFSFSSCEKDDNNPPAKTKTELITQGNWKFSSATVGGGDVSAFIQPCQKDNILTFVAAGFTGTVDEGLTKCNAGDNQTTNFTWSWINSETQMNVSATLIPGGSGTFTLVSLSETQLVLSQQTTLTGSPQTAVVTFVH